VADAILDAAAQGRVVVRRGPLAVLYPSSFVLVGSMNPEEGPLRPQIQDRFGLRILVDGLADPGERLEVYRRVRFFREHPHRLAGSLAAETLSFAEGIGRAREMLPSVELTAEAESLALDMVRSLQIPSHRAEVTTLEAARACAAADERTLATAEDVALVAPMAMRQRRSTFIQQYFEAAQAEDREIQAACRAARKQEGP
jgi:magnesium chelatase subunit I